MIFLKRHKLTSVIIFGFLIIFAGAYFLGIPLVWSVINLSDEIQKKKIDAQFEESRFSSISRLEEELWQFDLKKDTLEIMISPENQINFIESIETIAAETGNAVTLQIGDIADPKEIAKIKKVSKKKGEEKGILDDIRYTNYFPIQINLKGDYAALCNFMHRLENNRFYVNVVSIDIKKSELEGSKEDIFNSEKEKTERKKEILDSFINAIAYTK